MTNPSNPTIDVEAEIRLLLFQFPQISREYVIQTALHYYFSGEDRLNRFFYSSEMVSYYAKKPKE
jgi:hypothetical protein